MRRLGLLALVGCSFVDARLAPDTLIDSGPPAITNQTSASFAFHGAGGADDFTCVLDDVVQEHCESPFAATDLGTGAHAFQVTAALGGAIDATPAKVAWRIDTSPPDTSLFGTPPTVDNHPIAMFQFTGTDNHTSVPALRFECLADPLANPDPWQPCASPFAFDVASVGDGRHTLDVRAVDQAGNVDPSPAEFTWDVRLEAPDTIIDAGPDEGGRVGTTVAFTFESTTGDALFDIDIDGELHTTTSSNVFSIALFPGPHTLSVAAFDGFGNADATPAVRHFITDATYPDIVFTQQPSDPSSDAMPVFAWTTHNPFPATYFCFLDGENIDPGFGPCASPLALGPLAAGPHELVVEASDDWGNVHDAVFDWTIAP